MRNYSINLKNRVKNFTLPKNRPLIPLYEAVVNSFHAIDERRSKDSSCFEAEIVIDVVRNQQQTLDYADLSDIEGFIITDNGIGFTENNMKSFLESDSDYKANLGGKGVGRFTWLKAFNTVSVYSFFKENGIMQKRQFVFSTKESFIQDSLIECCSGRDNVTSVTLDTYLDDYQSNVPKQLETIAMRVIQHCFVYFLDIKCPKVIIKDINNMFVLNKIFNEQFVTEESIVEFLVNGNKFNLLNVKIQDKAFRGNRMYLCANNRLVDSKDLENYIVDLDGQIFDRNNFWYVGVLTGSYLDDNVDMNRLSFSIPDNINNLTNNVSMEQIIGASCTHIEEYLRNYLLPISKEKIKRIEDYTTNVAPQFRHLLKYMPNEIGHIKPRVSNDKLDDELYDIKRKFNKISKEEQKKLFAQLDAMDMPVAEYEYYFNEQIKKISDANSSVLADYFAHRRVIIELFEKGLRKNTDGKFNKEKYMHSLIYPMRTTSDDIDYNAHNLWLIDEKLSYCVYISSDVPFDNDNNQERTDILMLDRPVAVSDTRNDGTVFDTIIIFELKRPMRNDYTDGENPITQLYDYVRRIRSNTMKDKNHRLIKVNESTKFYLYAVCDITSKMERFIELQGLTPTPDQLGFFDFNDKLNSYIEILSYDKILNDAKKRNRVLFEKLGI